MLNFQRVHFNVNRWEGIDSGHSPHRALSALQMASSWPRRDLKRRRVWKDRRFAVSPRCLRPRRARTWRETHSLIFVAGRGFEDAFFAVEHGRVFEGINYAAWASWTDGQGEGILYWIHLGWTFRQYWSRQPKACSAKMMKGVKQHNLFVAT